MSRVYHGFRLTVVAKRIFWGDYSPWECRFDEIPMRHILEQNHINWYSLSRLLKHDNVRTYLQNPVCHTLLRSVSDVHPQLVAGNSGTDRNGCAVMTHWIVPAVTSIISHTVTIYPLAICTTYPLSELNHGVIRHKEIFFK
jgi:hypothetical protein